MEHFCRSVKDSRYLDKNHVINPFYPRDNFWIDDPIKNGVQRRIGGKIKVKYAAVSSSRVSRTRVSVPRILELSARIGQD